MTSKAPYCWKCGLQIPVQAKFCTRCGTEAETLGATTLPIDVLAKDEPEPVVKWRHCQNCRLTLRDSYMHCPNVV